MSGGAEKSYLIPILPWWGNRYDMLKDEVITGWQLWCIRVFIKRPNNHEVRIAIRYGSKSIGMTKSVTLSQ